METKIIILSGKARSGKSECAKIIEKNLNKKVITISYASYLKEYTKNILKWDGSEDTKPRSFLQEIGDKVRQIDKYFLINRIIEDINIYKNYFDVIIISDARFIDEIKLIKNNFEDVTVIRINGKENNLNKKEKNHITETALDDYELYDYEINNDKDLNYLENKIKGIMEEII